MKRILVVDDEEAVRASLVLGLRAGLPGYIVLAAGGGREALDLLAREPVDLVITDLQMPEREELEWIAFLRREHPSLPVVVVSGRANAAEEVGTVAPVDCLTKPFSLDQLCRRVETLLAQTVRGRVENMNLASFLQLLEQEHKTCTLTVEAAGLLGQLAFLGGRLVDAVAGPLCGEEAALEIVTWENADIEMSGLEPAHPVAIEAHLSFLLMEGMRRKDEAAAKPREGAGLASILARLAALDGTAAALVGSEGDGKVLGAARGLTKAAAESMAREGATLLSRERQNARDLGDDDDAPEEILITGGERFAILRPLAQPPNAFLLVVLDRSKANLALTRMQISVLTDELAATS
jgi:CheY-like chemotaxis protein/predicted regulator of Ras-like GTPase activity (Roadblock/LC7/MglB family)